MKKVLRSILTVVLVIGLISNIAIADEVSVYNDFAEKLKSVGVFQGTGSGFELNRPPSRLEGGVMFVRLLGGEQEAIDNMYFHPFTDVPSWGDPYVGYLWHHGLTKGVADDKFGSTDTMIANSYMTFLLRALGYDDGAGDFSWAEALEKGNTVKLIDIELYNALTTDTFLRDHVAKLSYDVLKQNVKDEDRTLADKLIESGALVEEVAVEIGVLADNDTVEPEMADTNILAEDSPVSILTESEIDAIGAGGFSGTDLEIADQILEWQKNYMIYAGSDQNYSDVSYSMRWNYTFPNMYTTKDMLENMKDGNKYYGVCYHYATIYASIAQYYGLDVRVTNTTVKPSEVANNPFYSATSKGLSLIEYEAFASWLTEKNMNPEDYPYEAVRLVMTETPLHYRAEVKIDEDWYRFDQYDPITDGATEYTFVTTNWAEGEKEVQFNDYVTRLKNGEDLKGEGYANAYEEFLEGRLIKIETGEVDLFQGITDDAGNSHRASNIDEVMQGLGLVPYFNDPSDVLAFFDNAAWVNEEIDEVFDIKAQVETETGDEFFVICDLMIFAEVETISFDVYSTQYLGFTGEEVSEETFNTYIK